jgi:hypothetical protein
MSKQLSTRLSETFQFIDFTIYTSPTRVHVFFGILGFRISDYSGLMTGKNKSRHLFAFSLIFSKYSIVTIKNINTNRKVDVGSLDLFYFKLIDK